MSDIREAFERQFLPNKSELIVRNGESYLVFETAIAWKHYQAGAAMQKEKDIDALRENQARIIWYTDAIEAIRSQT